MHAQKSCSVCSAGLAFIAFVGLTTTPVSAVIVSDTTFSGGAGDFVRGSDTDDFYGVVDGTGPVTIGGTMATGVNTSPGIGDWLLQSNVGDVIADNTVMTTLSIAAANSFVGPATFSWTYDEEGTHEADDDLRMEIRDVGSGIVLASKIIGDDSATFADSLSVDATGWTALEARIMYVSGFDVAGEDGEEIQISNQSFSADDLPTNSSLRKALVTSGWTGVTEDASGGDFYGVLDSVGAGDSGTVGGMAFDGDGEHTNNDADDDIAWAIGDFVLEGDDSSVTFPAVGTTLATMDLSLPENAGDIDLYLSFLVDREGTLEANDALSFEIWDTVDNVLLDSLTLADDADFTVGDTFMSLTSLGHSGLTDVQARLVYAGGFDDGDAEEIQIGQARFAASFITIPEPGSFALWSMGIVGLAVFRRRRRG